jgi:DNA-binding NtrC family response regulator
MFTLHLPPLRARKSDVPALARAILLRLEREVGPKELGASALSRLLLHSFPGNVRELNAILYRAAAATPGREILAAHVDRALALSSRPKPLSLGHDEALLLLDQHAGNVSAAARSLGVPRSTFRSWVGK